MSKKILLIEMTASHTEIIAPIIKALQPHTVDVMIPTLGADRLPLIPEAQHIYRIQEATAVVEIMKHLRQHKYDLILMNSSQGKQVRRLMAKLFFDSTPVVGFHHNPQALVNSFTQKLINLKIKKYIVLAQFNKDYLVKKRFAEEKLHVFYPVMPMNVSTKSHSEKTELFSKALGKIVVAVPGVLEQARRDYSGLIDIIHNRRDEFKDVLIVLLGNNQTHDGPIMMRKIHSLGLQNNFVLFDHYVSDEDMHQWLLRSDFVMPLLHPGTAFFDLYLETKISGAYNLAYAYKKPLLMHESFRQTSEFQKNCQFYSFISLSTQLHKTVERDFDFYGKFDLRSQADSLQKFIFES